jgi:hypothetical protein
MKFIKSETIKAEVKEKLHIFFESNKVSDSLSCICKLYE